MAKHWQLVLIIASNNFVICFLRVLPWAFSCAHALRKRPRHPQKTEHLTVSNPKQKLFRSYSGNWGYLADGVAWFRAASRRCPACRQAGSGQGSPANTKSVRASIFPKRAFPRWGNASGDARNKTRQPLKEHMVNKQRLIKLTQNLIRIDSQNPPGDESRIAKFVQRYLDNLGLKAKIYEFKKKRSNVVAVLEGKDKKYSLLVTPHLDTVPVGKNWKITPFSGKIYRKRIYGLGATDCKGNLACILEAINSLIEEGAVLDYNLIFAATADEETGSSLGIIPLLEKRILRPDAALVLDADDFEIIITQKGLIHLKIKIQGRRAHGAYPERGINAIDIAVDIIKEIKGKKLGYIKNKYLKAPTVNVGTIKGGDKVNIVADWCEFELDFRFLPGTDTRGLLKDIKRIIQKHAKKFKIEIEGIQKPYRIEETHALVAYLKKAMENSKIKPVIKGSEGATTITFFKRKNIPAVATGFGSGGCAHIVDEYAKIDNLYQGAEVLEEFLKGYQF